MHQLEEELGVELLIHTPHGVELTTAGELFAEEARGICSQVRQERRRPQKAAEGKLGRLNIAIFGLGILRDIPKLLLNFCKRYPDVNIVLHTMTKGQQIEALRQRCINAGFNRLLSLPDIGSQLITTEKLLLAVNDRHPLAQEEADHITLACRATPISDITLKILGKMKKSFRANASTTKAG